MASLPEPRPARQLPDLTPASGLPAPLVERLAAAGVLSLRDWAGLSRRRKSNIFGVPPAMRRMLDALAEQQP